MTRLRLTICLLLTTLAGVGCDSASSVHPVGTPPVGEVAAQVDGVWVVDGDEPRPPIHLRYLGDGKLVAAGISWDDGAQEFKLDSFNGRLLEDDGVLFINFRPIDIKPKDQPAEEDQRYFFIRLVVREDGSMQVAAPRVTAFAAAVESGALDGSVVRKNNTTEVVITSAPQALNAFIDPDKADQQFELDKATVLKRIARPEDAVSP